MSVRASVSMSIPGYTGTAEDVPCLMTLDIHRKGINSIIMGLFGTKIITTCTSLSNLSRINLNGANVNEIENIFGLEIHNAISQCAVRKKEITDEQEQTTDCISVSLEGRTAWVRLTLDLTQTAANIIPKLQFWTRDTDGQ